MIEGPIDAAALGRSLEEALAAVPEAALERFATQRRLMGGGYRKGHPAVLRALIANALRPRLLTYDTDTATFLRTHLPEARLLSMLSREVLEQRATWFIAFFGKARFLLALLADPREDVRARVPERMAAEGNELPEPEAAGDLLAQAFSPIVQMGGGPAARERDRERIAELRQQLEASEKARRDERRKAEAEANTRDGEWKSRLATARFGVEERQREIDRLRAALEKERAERERRVQEELAGRQIRLFQGWLTPCLKAEALTAADPHAPLLERAEEAIAQQRRLDRASAQRAELSDRLGKTEAALARVDETLAGAMVRHSGLVAVRAELAAERDRLREALGDAEPDPLTAALSARIAAATEKDYEPTLTLLQAGERTGLIAKADADRLRLAFRRRVATWDLGAPDAAKDAEAALDALEAEGAAAERRNPALVKALRGAAPAMLFLDGHNILNGIGRYRQRRGMALTHEAARLRVERDAASLLRNLPMVFAHLVWDGTEASEHAASDNVAVHYSGGQGEHRADRYILDQLRFYRERFEHPLIVVTDDNGFAGEARKLGADVCRLHDFEAFLNGPPAP